MAGNIRPGSHLMEHFFVGDGMEPPEHQVGLILDMMEALASWVWETTWIAGSQSACTGLYTVKACSRTNDKPQSRASGVRSKYLAAETIRVGSSRLLSKTLNFVEGPFALTPDARVIATWC